MSFRDFVLSLPLVAVLGFSPAWSADPVYGRITYVYPDGRHFILDGRKKYELAADVDPSSIGMARFVALLFGAGNEVTRVAPLPASLAGPWPSKS